MNRLRQLRGELAVWGLATRAKCSPAMISAIENYDYMPGARVREKLAAVLGVKVGAIWPDLPKEEDAAKRATG